MKVLKQKNSDLKIYNACFHLFANRNDDPINSAHISLAQDDAIIDIHLGEMTNLFNFDDSMPTIHPEFRNEEQEISLEGLLAIFDKSRSRSLTYACILQSKKIFFMFCQSEREVYLFSAKHSTNILERNLNATNDKSKKKAGIIICSSQKIWIISKIFDPNNFAPYLRQFGD